MHIKALSYLYLSNVVIASIGSSKMGHVKGLGIFVIEKYSLILPVSWILVLIASVPGHCLPFTQNNDIKGLNTE